MRVSEIRVKQIRVNQGLGVLYASSSDTYYCYGRNTIVVLMRNKRCALTCKSQLPIEPNRKRCDMSECLENEFANKQLNIYYWSVCLGTVVQNLGQE